MVGAGARRTKYTLFCPGRAHQIHCTIHTGCRRRCKKSKGADQQEGPHVERRRLPLVRHSLVFGWRMRVECRCCRPALFSSRTDIIERTSHSFIYFGRVPRPPLAGVQPPSQPAVTSSYSLIFSSERERESPPHACFFFISLSCSLAECARLPVSSRCAQSISTGVWMDAARPLIHFLCSGRHARVGSISASFHTSSFIYVNCVLPTHTQTIISLCGATHQTRFYFNLVCVCLLLFGECRFSSLGQRQKWRPNSRQHPWASRDNWLLPTYYCFLIFLFVW